ncbi:MAG: hypothetical protein IAG10_03435, partial [Planctomycetaceae bacterium]|nr:hypothetical protein [Planctomycetaceae bacterium]
MISGDKPFARPTLMATLRSIGSDVPRELDASIPSDVAALVKRLLEKRPEDRFASCPEVITAIEACQQSQLRPLPVTATAPQKEKPRRAWIATAAAAALVLMFGVIVTVKDKNGKTLLRYLVPDGGTVEVASDNEETTHKTNVEKPVSKAETPASTVPHVRPPVVADHLPPMSPAALVQRPPKLTVKDGEAVQSWTV